MSVLSCTNYYLSAQNGVNKWYIEFIDKQRLLKCIHSLQITEFTIDN